MVAIKVNSQPKEHAMRNRKDPLKHRNRNRPEPKKLMRFMRGDSDGSNFEEFVPQMRHHDRFPS